MTKAKSTPHISFRAGGRTHVFEMPEDKQAIPWEEIRNLILQELIRQFSKGDVYLEIHHFCNQCDIYKLFDKVALNKAALMEQVEKSVGQGEAAAARALACLETSAECEVLGIMKHFYPPKLRGRVQDILRNLHLTGYPELN